MSDNDTSRIEKLVGNNIFKNKLTNKEIDDIANKIISDLLYEPTKDNSRLSDEEIAKLKKVPYKIEHNNMVSSIKTKDNRFLFLRGAVPENAQEELSDVSDGYKGFEIAVNGFAKMDEMEKDPCVLSETIIKDSTLALKRELLRNVLVVSEYADLKKDEIIQVTVNKCFVADIIDKTGVRLSGYLLAINVFIYVKDVE